MVSRAPVLEYEPYSLASDEERKKAEHERSANAMGRALRAYFFFIFEECSYFFLYLLKIHDRQFLCLYLKKYDHQRKKKEEEEEDAKHAAR